MKGDNQLTWSQRIIGKVPSKPNCYKIGIIAGHGTLIKQANLKKYETDFYAQCVGRRPNSNPMFRGFFHMDVDVYMENLRQDLDNTLKVILDCLESCNIIRNDKNCLEINARKFVDKTEPRVLITLTEIFNNE